MPNISSLKIGLAVAFIPSLIIYLLSSSILFTAIILLALTYYFYRYSEHYKNRKEPLKIFLGEEQLHFILSDDDFLDIPLDKTQNLSEVITDTIKKEISTLKRLVDKIYLVNIKDDQLESQLNIFIKN